MNISLVAADAGTYYSLAAAFQINALDFVYTGRGPAPVTATAGNVSFRLDVTAGATGPNVLNFTLSQTTGGTKLCEGAATCAPGKPSITPISGPFIATPKPGGYLGTVLWDGTSGLISIAFTWIK